MLNDKFKNHSFILASNSPRRQELFKALGLKFSIRTKEIEETYDKSLKREEITRYLANLKASAFQHELKPNDILITADTIVWHRGKALEKPKNKQEAIAMLQLLSGTSHEVVTSVCIVTSRLKNTLTEVTKVHFNNLSLEEITFYVENHKPYDKAGAYGIQEWIGYVGVSKLEGCYYNVMGLPVKNLYEELKKIEL